MKRDWSLAVAKIQLDNGGRCRVCNAPGAQAAHTIGRRYDTEIAPGIVQVHPDSVVGLCAPHHDEYDQHQLDLLPYLRREEEVDAVLRVGIERARNRLCPSLGAIA